MVTKRVSFNQLEPGYEFPPSSFKLDSAAVSAYIRAVEDTTSLYQGAALVPPLAVAALAMTALTEGISLPPGTIHVSQEFEFSATVTTDDTVTSFASVSRKHSRGKLHLLTVSFKVLNQKQQAVLAGKTSFILPENNGAEGA
jgi:acyl dehydratase